MKLLFFLIVSVSSILGRIGEVKPMDPFDEYGWAYSSKPEQWSPGAKISRTPDKEDKIEGNASLVLNYSFTGESADPARKESVFILRNFGNWRPDLSFHPLALSIWIKGEKNNVGELSFSLMQDSDMGAGWSVERQRYRYVDRSGAIRKNKWTRLVIPYEAFEPCEGTDVPLDLSRVMGWRIDIENTDGVVSSGSRVHLDNLEQLTTYKAEWNRKARFSSLFIQISKVYANTDWDKVFSEGKSVGIDTWFLQYCLGHKGSSHCSYYKNCNLDWITERYDIVDRMFEAAEKADVKIIVGPLFQYWGETDYGKIDRYAEMYEVNRKVIDELAANFGKSPSFAGWYIADEFHDGTGKKTFYSEEATECLGWYLETTAVYMKSKKDVPVSIAPALWKGYPAELTGKWFGRLFSKTPSVDNLYLQDCCGRGPDVIMSVSVDLPNYYTEIKKACVENGVSFGVDIESFFRCSMLKIPRTPKTWERLRDQLWMAGNFTDNITNFSWASFKPGTKTFEGYKEYFNKLGEGNN